MGLGVMIRNTAGGVMLAASKCVEMQSSIEVGESVATRYGLSLAANMGYRDIPIKLDNILVAHAIKNQQYSLLNQLGHIAEDIHVQSLNFASFQIVHVPREANQVAHKLSRFTFELDGECIWVEDSSDVIFNALSSDVQNKIKKKKTQLAIGGEELI